MVPGYSSLNLWDSGFLSKRTQVILGDGMPAVDRQLSIADSPTRMFWGSLGWISTIGAWRAVVV